jgi:antitoxin (DNA-binding transcriptional repressor) of toxin-antitoxin stability system
MALSVRVVLTGACLVLLALPVWGQGAGLRAGAAKNVITPEVGPGRVHLAGFGNNRVAAGVHDDLYARCLALAAGESTVAVCAVDLVGLFYDDVVKIRERVKAQAPGTTHVVVAATHTHAGPDTMGLWGPTQFVSGIDENYLAWVDERVAATATAALRSLGPARLTLARDDHPLLAQLQGDSRPPYVKDPFLFVMHLASTSGRPIGTLVNWSDHPETLGRKNTEITADYPHWLCRVVEESLGGTAVFVNGSIGGLISTLGNQVALQDPDTGEIASDGTWRKAELFGNALAELAARAVKAGEEVEIDSLVVRKAIFFAPLENERFRVAGAAGVYKSRKPLYTDGELDAGEAEREFPDLGKLKYLTGEDVQTEVDYIQLTSHGRVVAEVVTVPGEIYPELINGGITRYPGADYPDAPLEPALRARMKSKYQFVVGLGNDELGYIIPKAEWDNQAPWLLERPARWYGESNSVGPDLAGAVMRALVGLMGER